MFKIVIVAACLIIFLGFLYWFSTANQSNLPRLSKESIAQSVMQLFTSEIEKAAKFWQPYELGDKMVFQADDGTMVSFAVSDIRTFSSSGLLSSGPLYETIAVDVTKESVEQTDSTSDTMTPNGGTFLQLHAVDPSYKKERTKSDNQPHITYGSFASGMHNIHNLDSSESITIYDDSLGEKKYVVIDQQFGITAFQMFQGPYYTMHSFVRNGEELRR